MNKPLLQIVKDKWEKVPLRGAHIKFKDENEPIIRFKKLLTSKINVNKKTIIDYGCGGGFLGKHLLESFNIKKYIAYDVAERSLNSAKERLEKYKNKTEFNLINSDDIKFIEKKPDIFCCFACMLHFPTEIYLQKFLKNVNESKADILILEIRNLNKKTFFWKEPYKNFNALIRACITEPKYISEYLSNYKLYEMTDHNAHPTNCQILYYERKK